jgi:hypothetical protein
LVQATMCQPSIVENTGGASGTQIAPTSRHFSGKITPLNPGLCGPVLS